MSHEHRLVDLHLVHHGKSKIRVRRVIIRTTPALLREAETWQVERNHVPTTRGEWFHDVSPTKRTPTESVDQDQRRIAATPRGCNNGAASFNGDDRGVRCSTSGEQLLWLRLRAGWEINQEGEEGNYEQHLKEPFQALITDLEPDLLTISPHYRADPRGNGGSLFRIHRDTRFSNDKTPYKTWSGARFFHERSKTVPAPSFYLHLQPGDCFIGAGLWHPETETVRKVRHFIVDNPGSWKVAAHGSAFRKRFDLEDSEMLVRMPRGFPDDFEFAEDLRRKNFVAFRALDDDLMTGPRLLKTVEKDLAALGPFTDYLCAALDLEF